MSLVSVFPTVAPTPPTFFQLASPATQSTVTDQAQITANPSVDRRAEQLNATPTTPCCDPNIVVVNIQTSVTIFNFHSLYRDQDINTFNPDYFVTPDGTLLTSIFASELKTGARSLLMIGAYIILFLWNSLAAVGFIFRIKVKDKTIFYLLLAGQISALIPWIILTVGVFSHSTDCRAILRATSFFLEMASSFVLTGVFGFKAYRCLFNSRIVLVGLSCFQLAHITLQTVKMVHLKGFRQVNGVCAYETDKGFIPAILVVTVLEAIFIATCFLLTVWRTSRLLAAQGRLSFRESLREPFVAVGSLSNSVSQVQRTSDISGSATGPLCSSSSSPLTMATPEGVREKTTPSDLPLVRQTAFPREFWVRKLATSWMDKLRGSHVVSAMTGSSIRLAFKPRLVLFREVMRDELCYTTVLAAAAGVSAIFALIGTFQWQEIFNTHEWSSFYLAIMSVLAVHSMRRTVRRDEQERLLQDSRLNDPMRRAVHVGPYSDGLSFRTSTLAFNTSSSARDSARASPAGSHTRNGGSNRRSRGQSSIASEDSSHAILDNIRSSWDSTEFPPAARRSSYGSMSTHSMQSIEYLAQPLTIVTQNLTLPPDWPQATTP